MCPRSDEVGRGEREEEEEEEEEGELTCGVGGEDWTNSPPLHPSIGHAAGYCLKHWFYYCSSLRHWFYTRDTSIWLRL